jgi:hypothetical protein
MAEYQCYQFDRRGEIIAVHASEHPGDHSAARWGAAMLEPDPNCRAVEVWRLDRCVCRLERTRLEFLPPRIGGNSPTFTARAIGEPWVPAAPERDDLYPWFARQWTASKGWWSAAQEPLDLLDHLGRLEGFGQIGEPGPDQLVHGVGVARDDQRWPPLPRAIFRDRNGRSVRQAGVEHDEIIGLAAEKPIGLRSGAGLFDGVARAAQHVGEDRADLAVILHQQ